MKDQQKIMCPSYRGKEGAQLLGVNQPDGSVAILPQVMAVDKNFLEKAKTAQSAPEERFRFTGKCIEKGCKQWAGRCTLSDHLIRQFESFAAPTPIKALQPCPIRSNCRWYRQSGAEACKVCVYVITDMVDESL